MWLTRLWSWVREHRGLAAIFAVLLALAVGSAWSAYRFRSEAIQAKQELKKNAAAAEDLKREEEIQRVTWERQLGNSEARLAQALRDTRALRARLGEIEARRRNLFLPPAIDNLAVRFDRAIEALR